MADASYPKLPTRWITVDIGESTGWALLEEERLVDSGTTELWEFLHSVGDAATMNAAEHSGGTADLERRFWGWDTIVVEDWTLDPEKCKALAWDTQDTVRGLGVLQYIAERAEREFVLQPRTIKGGAKSAGAEDLFVRPLHENRHRNDAVMHAVYFAGVRGKGLVAAE